jgi:hypothetical protein
VHDAVTIWIVTAEETKENSRHTVFTALALN